MFSKTDINFLAVRWCCNFINATTFLFCYVNKIYEAFFLIVSSKVTEELHRVTDVTYNYRSNLFQRKLRELREHF